MPELILEPRLKFADQLVSAIAPLLNERIPETVTYRHVWLSVHDCKLVFLLEHEGVDYSASVEIESLENRPDTLEVLKLILARWGCARSDEQSEDYTRRFTLLDQHQVEDFAVALAHSITDFFDKLYPPALLEFSSWRKILRKPKPAPKPVETEPVTTLSEDQLAVFTHEHAASGSMMFEIKTAFLERPHADDRDNNRWLVYGYGDGDTVFYVPAASVEPSVMKDGSWYSYNPATGAVGVHTYLERMKLLLTPINKDD